MGKILTLPEIKEAVLSGKSVYWSNNQYKVVHDCKDQWLIVCQNNNHAIGLTWLDGTTVNGKLEDFYIVEED